MAMAMPIDSLELAKNVGTRNNKLWMGTLI